MLAAFLHPEPGRPWASGGGETQADLVARARRVAALIEPARGRVVLSCRHARSFVPGLLGAWLAGATVELLPNAQPGTLERIDADEGVARVLHDLAANATRSRKAIYLPAIGGAGAIVDPGLAPAACPPAVAVCMTTSGTTARPRYISKSFAQLLGELDVLAAVIPAARCVMSTVPLSHFYGLQVAALLPLRFGARIVSHDALLPADIAVILERESVDLLISTPAHLRAMAAVDMPRGLRVISAGARLPAELHAALVTRHAWQVTDVLGATEAGCLATRAPPSDAWVPLPGVTVSAPHGQLVVESPWCDGARVELDDRIELAPDGRFHHLGRGHELVKIAGKRAHAHALEATALGVPGVTDAALAVHESPDREPRVALAITVAPDGPAVDRQHIADAIRNQFDAVFVPRIVKVVARIPRSERGKLDTRALRVLLGLDERGETTGGGDA